MSQVKSRERSYHILVIELSLIVLTKSVFATWKKLCGLNLGKFIKVFVKDSIVPFICDFTVITQSPY